MSVNSINPLLGTITTNVASQKENPYKKLIKLSDLYTKEECKEIIKTINKNLYFKIPKNQVINGYYDPNQSEIFISNGYGAGGIKIKSNGKAILFDGKASPTKPIELKDNYSALFNQTIKRYHQTMQSDARLTIDMNNLAQIGKSQCRI